MTIKNRLAKLEKRQADQTRPQNGDGWKLREVNYRAGIDPTIPDPAGTQITVRWVDYKQGGEEAGQ